MSIKQTLKLSNIRLDGNTQPRDKIDEELVETYAEQMTAGAKFTPVEVYCDEVYYWLVDGFHRVMAAKQIGKDEIEALVSSESKEVAQWDSYAANKHHDRAGKRRTNMDKQRAVYLALSHKMAEDMSNVQIAEHIGVSDETVRKYREVIFQSLEDTSQDAVKPEPTTRTVTRGEKTYEMEVGKIGKKKVVPIEGVVIDHESNEFPRGETEQEENTCDDAFACASDAINCLLMIEKNNPDRAKAIQSVTNWIVNNK